jgi:YegS/Rv2252/BmrU family lipid kinase
MRPLRLIVNPSAGGGRAGRVLADVEAALRDAGWTVTTQATRDLEHARDLGSAAAEAGDLAVALGGDGLIGAVAAGLSTVPGAVLGALPGGRGNDLARGLGIPLEPLEAVAVISTGVERDLDLGAVGERRFVGVASGGFDSEANRLANEAPAWLGGLVYAYGALRALISWRPATFRVTVDGQASTFQGYSFAAANSKAYGGGMFIAPDAEPDDGLLDIVLTEHVSKLRFLASLPKVFKGTHVNEPTVRVLRGREVHVSADRAFTIYADGDPIGELPAVIRSLPQAVRILVPR